MEFVVGTQAWVWAATAAFGVVEAMETVAVASVEAAEVAAVGLVVAKWSVVVVAKVAVDSSHQE
ncbi:MAG TPA: hypothetical protein VLF64_03220 [Candidatus Saccharimonadales bacterium]|nr:hypothetical protein [Candidatus Saccharimonadales bacterium]